MMSQTSHQSYLREKKTWSDRSNDNPRDISPTSRSRIPLQIHIANIGCWALHALCIVLDTDVMTDELWLQALAHEERIQRRISEQVYLSRKKDHDNPFRAATCRNEQEALIIFGEPEDNKFVCQVREEMLTNIRRIERLRNQL